MEGRSHLGQVHDMDVVADAGAIACWVVAAKHAERIALAERHLLHVRHQVVGNAHRVLPDLPCTYEPKYYFLYCRNRRQVCSQFACSSLEARSTLQHHMHAHVRDPFPSPEATREIFAHGLHGLLIS